MQKQIDALPNWTFQVEEVSAGVYKLRATQSRGANIELTGIDPEELLKRAKKDAEEMERSLTR
jgi:hypothetical protein